MDEKKAHNRQRFNTYAQAYVKSKTHAKGQELAGLVELAKPQPDWHVLDVATGGGHTALAFAPHVAQVTATDLAPAMLEAAQGFIQGQGIQNVDFKLADAENLPFDDASFDLVTCRIAPHHFPTVQRFIFEAVRVLKLGGKLLIQDHVVPDDRAVAAYINNFEQLRDPSHNRILSRSEWQNVYQEAGLKVLHQEEITKRHQLIPWAERQGNSPELIAELQGLLQAAPIAAGVWLESQAIGTDQASFVNHHIIILGVKAQV